MRLNHLYKKKKAFENKVQNAKCSSLKVGKKNKIKDILPFVLIIELCTFTIDCDLLFSFKVH